jgi:nucleoside-diphosphate-sugar epimerase
MDASNDTLKTVVICPPDIYGQSSSVGSRTTFLVPNYVEALIKHKEAFYLGDGDNMRAVTHIDDVVDIFILLIDEALKDGGRAQWGKEGFYFAVSGEVRWKDAAQAIRKLGNQQGWLEESVETVSWDKEKLVSKFPGQGDLVLYLWGSNSRAESARAKQLGWNPHGPSFWEALPEDVEIAAKNVQCKSL